MTPKLREILIDQLRHVATVLGDDDPPFACLGDWIDQELPWEAFEYESAEQAESIGHAVGMATGAALALDLPLDTMLRKAGIIPSVARCPHCGKSEPKCCSKDGAL